MNEIIENLVQVDKKAKERVLEAQVKRKSLDKDLSDFYLKSNNESKELLEKKIKTLDEKYSDEQKNKVLKLENNLEKTLNNLNEQYIKNNNSWQDEVINKILRR